MIFLRRYVLIAMGENRIMAFFNTLEDASEHAAKLRTTYPTKYSTVRIFQETTQ